MGRSNDSILKWRCLRQGAGLITEKVFVPRKVDLAVSPRMFQGWLAVARLIGGGCAAI